MGKRRRGNGEGSIYQRKSDGKWCGASHHEGRRFVVYSDSAAGVRAALAARRAELVAGVAARPAVETVAGFVARWLDESAALTCGPKTLRTYRDLLRLHVEGSALGGCALGKLAPAAVAEFLSALRSKQYGRAGKTLSPSTVHAVFRMLRAALNVAVSWRLISRNPVAAVRMPAVPRGRGAVLSAAEARALLGLLAGHRLEALFSLSVASGMRQAELLGLLLSDLDLEGGRLHVRRQLQRVGGTLRESAPKLSSRRSILLPGFVCDQLRAHLARRREAAELAGESWQESGRLFVSGLGGPVDARNLTREWYRIRARLGREDLRFHDLRHSAATILHVAGVPVTAIQHLLGHHSDRTTRDIYMHVAAESERAAADAMDALLQPKRRAARKNQQGV